MRGYLQKLHGDEVGLSIHYKERETTIINMEKSSKQGMFNLKNITIDHSDLFNELWKYLITWHQLL